MNGLGGLGALFLEVECLGFFFPWDYLFETKKIQKLEKKS